MNRIKAIWIEAEVWALGTWQADDANTDVVVTRKDESRWIASFFTYKNILTLVEKTSVPGSVFPAATYGVAI